jgi:hypothetical protein
LAVVAEEDTLVAVLVALDFLLLNHLLLHNTQS